MLTTRFCAGIDGYGGGEQSGLALLVADGAAKAWTAATTAGSAG